jgi:hypothetical protein
LGSTGSLRARFASARRVRCSSSRAQRGQQGGVGLARPLDQPTALRLVYGQRACGSITHVEPHCAVCGEVMHATDVDVEPN